MNTLNEVELLDIDGGVIPLIGIAVGAYVGLLREMKESPQDYTWMMDWYYQS